MGSKVKLVELTSKIGSGSTPTGGKSAYLDSGLYKLIRSQNIYNHFFSEGGLAYITEEQATKLKGVTLEKDDILINITGDSVARVAMVTEQMLPGRVNQHVSIIRCNKEKINPYYLLAILTSDEMQRHLLSLAQVGGTRAALTKSMLENLEVDLLEKHDQEFVANLLKNINSKVENNKAIITNLELICSTLFKRWFIDFEFPNEQGLPYRSSGGEMVGSELGEIPLQWDVVQLGDLSETISKGTTPRKKDLEKVFEAVEIPFLKVKDISDNGEIDYGSLEKIPLEIHNNQLKRSKSKPKDILISIAGTIGRVSYIPEVIKELNMNQAVAFVRLKDRNHFNFIYSAVRESNFENYLIEKTVQAVQANVSLTTLKEFKLCFPDDKILHSWNEKINAIYKMIENLRNESLTLKNTRDTLIPKLLSGEIEIPDESVVERS